VPKGVIALLLALCALIDAPDKAARAGEGYVFESPAPADAAPTPTAALDKTTAGEAPRPLSSGLDESALRYYASHNQTARVDAEIARLQRFYPDWRPPKDLYDSPAGSDDDESDLWDLYSADKMSELDAAIEARKAEQPGWQPSKDLQQKIRRKTARLAIAGYLKQGHWQDIVDYVHRSDAAADADVDVSWTVAEAFARTKQVAEAQRIYKAILANDKNPGERLATIQKAMAVLRMTDVEPLVAMGARPDGSSEFGSIMVDISRARVAAYLHDERTEDVADGDLKLFEDYARSATDPNQAGLVGWYAYKHRDFRGALDWFKLSLAHGGDAMVAHGLAHSLRALGYMREAEEVAYAWREPLVNNALLFIDLLEADLTREVPPPIEPERLYRYAEETLRLASGEGAQALAWYSYNTCQFDTALAWFARATAWRPKEATSYGYALTLRRLRRREDFLDVVNRYDGLFPMVVGILFPDDERRPPTPCERRGYPRPEAQPRTADGVPVPGSAPQGQTESAIVDEAELKLKNSLAATPRADRAPKISRSDFPISVDPENDLRFAAAAGPLLARAASDSALTRESSALQLSLVARRVPGVGSMPYERYGFALLAAYNGQTAASPPHSALAAAAGTPWAEQRAQAETGPTLRLDLSGRQAASQTSAPGINVAASAPYKYGDR
jgi:cellulose synthase operon protein C